MKKILKGILILCMALVSTLAFMACGEVELKSIYVVSESDTIEISYGEDWDFNTEIKIKGKLSNGETMDIALDMCDVDAGEVNLANISNVVGKHQVEITYNSIYTTSIYIEVKRNAEKISVNTDVDVLYGKTVGIEEIGLKVEYSDGSTENITENYEIYDLSGNKLDEIPTNVHGDNSVKIVYNGMETIFAYNVNKVISEVSVGGIYSRFAVYGNDYDYSGVTVVIKYSDGSSTYLDLGDEEITFEGIDVNVKGEQTFTVTYKGKTAQSETIEVGAEIDEIIYKSGLADRIKYDLIPKTVKVDVNFSDGTSETVDANVIYADPLFALENEELVEFTITFGGKSITRTATVYQQLEGLEITPKTNTSNYILVGEGIDLTKFFIYKKYTKTTEKIDSSAVEISSLLGDVTDGYYYEISLKEDNSISTSITVFVINDWSEIPELSISAVKIISGVPNTVAQGKNTLDLSNVKLEVTYSNGIALVVNYDSEKMTSTFNGTVLGKQTLSITVDGKTAEQEINVLRDLVSVTVKTDPTLSVKYGTPVTDIDVSGIRFQLNFSYGDPVIVLASELENISGVNVTRPISLVNHKATASLTFAVDTENYFDNDVNTASINIEVYEKLESISISGVSDKVYCSQTEDYDVSGLIIREVYTSGTTVKVDNPQNYVVTTVNRKLCETQKFTVEYKDKVATISVRVLDFVNNYEIVIDSEKTIYIDDTEDTVKGYITLIPTFESGREVTEADYVKAGFSVEIDTTIAGEDVLLEVSYNGKKYSTSVAVVNNYTVLGVSDPTFVATYNTAKNSLGVDTPYYVGTQNPFKYDIQVSVQYKKDSSIGMLTTFKMNVVVKMLDGDNYVELSDYDEYVTIDSLLHTIEFKESAIGKSFEIIASLDGDTDPERVSSFKFDVVKGYNVYNAYELSVIDNLNAKNKWDEIKGEHGLTNVSTDRVILHNNITVKAEHVPSIHFYKESEVKANDKDVLWGDPIVGSLKDHRSDLALGYIYYRHVEDGKSFTLDGNCFQIDASEMPLIYRQEVDGVALPRETKETAITTHTAMFFIGGKKDINTGTRQDNPNVAQISISELQFFGNAKKSANTTLSGGVIGFKLGYAKANLVNNVVKSTYIGFLTEGIGDYYESYEFKFDNCSITDAFQTLLYVWGCKAVYIDSCTLSGAGGPVIIADHVDNEPDDDPNGGFPSNIYVDTLKEEDEPKSVIESFVTGEEGWFQTYGATQQVGQLKTLDPLFNPYKKTILKDVDKINLVAAYKSGSQEGITESVIQGSFNYGGHTSMSFEDQYLQTMLSGLMTSGQQGVIIGTCNKGETNTFGMPGTTGWLREPDPNLFMQSEDYLYIYLFNGMVAVVGLNDFVTA